MGEVTGPLSESSYRFGSWVEARLGRWQFDTKDNDLVGAHMETSYIASNYFASRRAEEPRRMPFERGGPTATRSFKQTPVGILIAALPGA